MSARDAERPRILYVEDDPDYLEAVRVMLESGGFRMEGAGSAEEGLRSFRADPPDAVLVDMMMEEVDAGANLVRELRATGADVPIYLLSSLGDALADTRDWSDLGVAGVLQKPVRRDTLLTLLRARLDEAPAG
jgi:DNA-binding response OmpR family regulator